MPSRPVGGAQATRRVLRAAAGPCLWAGRQQRSLARDAVARVSASTPAGAWAGQAGPRPGRPGCSAARSAVLGRWPVAGRGLRIGCEKVRTGIAISRWCAVDLGYVSSAPSRAAGRRRGRRRRRFLGCAGSRAGTPADRAGPPCRAAARPRRARPGRPARARRAPRRARARPGSGRPAALRWGDPGRGGPGRWRGLGHAGCGAGCQYHRPVRAAPRVGTRPRSWVGGGFGAIGHRRRRPRGRPRHPDREHRQMAHRPGLQQLRDTGYGGAP
jgi:hypothetical protein